MFRVILSGVFEASHSASVCRHLVKRPATQLLYAAQHNLFKGNYQICSCERAVLNIKLTARELGEIYSQIQQIDFHWENGRVAPRSHVFAVPINVETQ